MRALELKIPPPLVMLLTVAAMWGLAKIGSPLAGPHPLRHVVSPLFAGAGVALALSGIVAFRLQRTTMNPHTPNAASSLVTGGVYRWTRNPMYLGLLLVLLGWEFHLWSPWAIAGPVAFVAYITRFQIVPEERVMREKFGDAFVAYTARVRRWL